MDNTQGKTPDLVGAFDAVLRRVERQPSDKGGRVLAALAAALATGDEINLQEIDELADESDQALGVALFDYCMAEGLTEEERAEIARRFAPFADLHKPGTRH